MSNEETQVIKATTVKEYLSKLSERARKEYGEKNLQKEVTQGEYAEIIGVSKATIQTWESGRNYPKAAQLAILAWHIGASADEVIADLIRLETPRFAHHIPKNLRDQQFSIPRFVDVLNEMPADTLFQVHHKVLDILNDRLKKWVDDEKNKTLNGES